MFRDPWNKGKRPGMCVAAVPEIKQSERRQKKTEQTKQKIPKVEDLHIIGRKIFADPRNSINSK